MQDERPPRSVAELAREALEIQDACNLSGVVHAFSRAVSDLWKQPGASTPFVNDHFVCRLFADKVAHLTGTQTLCNERVMAAYAEASELVHQGERAPAVGAR